MLFINVSFPAVMLFGSVFRRHNLTSKIDSRSERIEKIIMALDPCTNEAERAITNSPTARGTYHAPPPPKSSTTNCFEFMGMP